MARKTRLNYTRARLPTYYFSFPPPLPEIIEFKKIAVKYSKLEVIFIVIVIVVIFIVFIILVIFYYYYCADRQINYNNPS